MIKNLFIAWSVCLFCLPAVAQQNLTGRWQWTIQGGGKDLQTDYLIELDLKQEGSRLYGLRTLYLKDFDDVVVKVEGSISPTGAVQINSREVVQNTLPDSILVATSFSYKLQTRSVPAGMLDGSFYPREDTAKRRFRMYDPVFYDGIYTQSFASPFKKLSDTLSVKAQQRMNLKVISPVTKPAPVVATDIQSRLVLPFADISIDLYDNGEIDGDSITLLVNDKVVAEHKRLSTHAVHFDLKKEDFADTTTIVMRAENLGSIPPNTAVMLLTCLGKRYDVRLSSDLKRQAAVVLYKKQ